MQVVLHTLIFRCHVPPVPDAATTGGCYPDRLISVIPNLYYYAAAWFHDVSCLMFKYIVQLLVLLYRFTGYWKICEMYQVDAYIYKVVCLYCSCDGTICINIKAICISIQSLTWHIIIDALQLQAWNQTHPQQWGQQSFRGDYCQAPFLCHLEKLNGNRWKLHNLLRVCVFWKWGLARAPGK